MLFFVFFWYRRCIAFRCLVEVYRRCRLCFLRVFVEYLRYEDFVIGINEIFTLFWVLFSIFCGFVVDF